MVILTFPPCALSASPFGSFRRTFGARVRFRPLVSRGFSHVTHTGAYTGAYRRIHNAPDCSRIESNVSTTTPSHRVASLSKRFRIVRTRRLPPALEEYLGHQRLCLLCLSTMSLPLPLCSYQNSRSCYQPRFVPTFQTRKRTRPHFTISAILTHTASLCFQLRSQLYLRSCSLH